MLVHIENRTKHLRNLATSAVDGSQQVLVFMCFAVALHNSLVIDHFKDTLGRFPSRDGFCKRQEGVLAQGGIMS